MISLLAFALLQAAAPEADIVVLGRKLNATHVTWRASDRSGAWRMKYCRIQQSSGDRDVDALACTALSECLVEIPVGYKGKDAPPGLFPCVTEHRRHLLQDLADRRAAEAGQ